MQALKNKIIVTYGLILLLCVIATTIGYSAYNTNMMIKDSNIKVRVNKDVRVTSINPSENFNGGISNSEDFNVDTLSLNVRLPEPNSTVSYVVEVKNYGNVEMGINNIELPENYKNIFDIEISDYTLGDKIRDNQDECEESIDGCKLSIKRTFKLTLSYKDGAYNSNKIVYENLTLKLNFKEAYKVTFTGFTILEPSIQAKSALEGSTYVYNIGVYETLLVKMNGAIITDYTIDSNNLLTIPNVTGDIEIIISEVELPFKLTTQPSDSTISYEINGIKYDSVTGILQKDIIIGSTLKVKVSKYGYKTVEKEYLINNEIIDSINLSEVFYLNINTNPLDASISYKVNGELIGEKYGTFLEEFDPNTVVDVNISRENYKTINKTYTMNEHHIENIDMVRQYSLNLTSPTPNAKIYVTYDGETYEGNGSYSAIVDDGSNISVSVVSNGYKTEYRNYQVTSDITESISLTKQYTYKIRTFNSSGVEIDSNITLKYNNENHSVLSGDSVILDEGTNIEVTITKNNYKSVTFNRTINSDINDDITLIRLYTYKINAVGIDPITNKEITTCDTTKYSCKVEITYNGKKTTGTTSASVTVEEGSSVSWSVSRDYFKSQSGTVNSVNGDITNKVTLSANDTKTSTIKLTQTLSASTYEKTSDPQSLSSQAKIISASSSGKLTNVASKTENKFYARTDTNYQFLYKDLSSKAGERNIATTYSPANLDSATVASSYTVTYGKSGWIYITNADITVTVKYISK